MCLFWLLDKQKSDEGLWPNGKTFLWGMMVGTTNVGGMITLVLAFQEGVTGLVSAIVALNVLIILLYTRMVLKENLSRLEWTGAVLSLIGIVVLRLT
nr:EamA family transporter [Ammoniphilus sp. YIM 78166]